MVSDTNLPTNQLPQTALCVTARALYGVNVFKLEIYYKGKSYRLTKPIGTKDYYLSNEKNEGFPVSAETLFNLIDEFYHESL